MIKYTVVLILAVTAFSCTTFPKAVKQELKEMSKNDEKYRRILVAAKKSEKDLYNRDSLLNYPESYSKRFLKKNRIYVAQATFNAIWKKQNHLDSLNYRQLISIIDKYGFPSRKNAGFFRYFDVSVMVVHYIKYEKELEPILKKACLEGKMTARDYAYFYDRCCLVNNREILYATSNLHPSKCIENLEKTNKARVEIGLKPIKQRKHCK